MMPETDHIETVVRNLDVDSRQSERRDPEPRHQLCCTANKAIMADLAVSDSLTFVETRERRFEEYAFGDGDGSAPVYESCDSSAGDAASSDGDAHDRRHSSPTEATRSPEYGIKFDPTNQGGAYVPYPLDTEVGDGESALNEALERRLAREPGAESEARCNLCGRRHPIVVEDGIQLCPDAPPDMVIAIPTRVKG